MKRFQFFSIVFLSLLTVLAVTDFFFGKPDYFFIFQVRQETKSIIQLLDLFIICVYVFLFSSPLKSPVVMQSPDVLNSVREFHETFKHPIVNEPAIPNEKRCKLRVSLIAEELREFQEAIEANDIVGVADALADIQYVLSGAVLEFGLGDKFKALFDEVQRSNMSKACKNIAEAEATVKHFEAKGTECHYVRDGSQYLVFRNEDNKLLKSIFYSPADLKGVLSEN